MQFLKRQNKENILLGVREIKDITMKFSVSDVLKLNPFTFIRRLKKKANENNYYNSDAKCAAPKGRDNYLLHYRKEEL
jgi:hypothetical protein